MTLGEKIKSLRLAAGMSQTELGDKVGVQTSAIYKYENGLVVNLKASTIQALADALGTTPTYLMGFNDEEKPTPVYESGPINPKAKKLIDMVMQMDDTQLDALETILDSVIRLRGQ